MDHLRPAKAVAPGGADQKTRTAALVLPSLTCMPSVALLFGRELRAAFSHLRALQGWRVTRWASASFDSGLLLYVLTLFIATRISLLVIGVISRVLIRPLLGQPLTTYTPLLVLDVWGVWDTRWYLDIARNGYSSTPIGPSGETTTAFFPLFPVLARIGAAIVGDFFLSGVLISNLALLISGITLHRLVMADGGDRRLAYGAVRYMFFFPSAFILSGFLSESLFLMLLLSCFYFARTGRWAVAGVVGFLLALVRPVGILATPALLLAYLANVRWNWSRIRLDISYLLLVPGGLIAYAVYLRFLTGNFFHFVQPVGSWGRMLSNPFEVLVRGMLSDNLHLLFGSWFLVACLALLVANARSLGYPYLILGLILLLGPLTTGMISLRSEGRYALAAFPLYISLARLGQRNSSIDHGLTGICAIFQGFLMVFWANRSALII